MSGRKQNDQDEEMWVSLGQSYTGAAKDPSDLGALTPTPLFNCNQILTTAPSGKASTPPSLLGIWSDLPCSGFQSKAFASCPVNLQVNRSAHLPSCYTT